MNISPVWSRGTLKFHPFHSNLRACSPKNAVPAHSMIAQFNVVVVKRRHTYKNALVVIKIIDD
jgi:hypothetical protein